MRLLRGRSRSGEESAPPAERLDLSAVQVLAHTLIAELFGSGLRVQNLAAKAPAEMHEELHEIADQIDKVIQELRAFAFTNGRSA